MSPAVFHDRDGTLMEEVHYCRDPKDVRLLPGVKDGLLRLKAAGFRNVIISNQSGIGRGLIKPEEYEAVHQRLMELLGEGLIEATYFCPEAPGEASIRRKPAPGMVLEAMRDLQLDLSASWFIGDRETDLLCGLAAGTRPILVQTGYGAETPSHGAFVAKDFTAAVEHILEERRKSANER